MKAAIIIHSETGNTRRVAEEIRAGLERIDGMEVAVMDIDAPDMAFVEEAAAVILGSPTYAGTCSWQMKRFLDTGKVKFAGKLGAVFATENYLGGGADAALLLMVSGLLVRGALVYSGGASLGQPYTHFGAVTIKDGDDATRERARIFGERIGKKAAELFG